MMARTNLKLKLEILDGRPREYTIRKNEEVACYIPEIRKSIHGGETCRRRMCSPAILAANSAPDLAEHYDIKKGEIARIAGYDRQSILLEPKDKLALWLSPAVCRENDRAVVGGTDTLNDKNHGDVEQSALRRS